MGRWVEKSEAEKEGEGARAMARERNRDEIRGGEKQQKLQLPQMYYIDRFISGFYYLRIKLKMRTI